MEITLARIESEMKEMKEKLVSLTVSAGESKNKGQPLGSLPKKNKISNNTPKTAPYSHVDVGIKLRTVTNPGSVLFDALF